MKVVLGASRNTTFKQCRRKYKYRYIDKLPQKDWPFFHLGTFVHRVLELWIVDLLEGKDPKVAAREAYAIARKEEAGVKIQPDDLEEAKILLRSYMKEYLAADIKTICTEKRFSFTLNNEFLVRGVLDRVDELEDGSLEIIDYKTTKNVERLSDDQLIIYTIAAKELFGKDKSITSSYVLLRHNNKKRSNQFTDEFIAEETSKLIEQGIIIQEEKEWLPTPSFFCNYCDYFMKCHQEAEFWTEW